MHLKPAFSLIEILIAVVVIGIMTATIVQVTKRKPHDDWKYVVTQCNTLVSLARQQAIIDKSVYRISCSASSLDQDSMYIEKEYENKEKPGVKLYQKIASSKG